MLYRYVTEHNFGSLWAWILCLKFAYLKRDSKLPVLRVLGQKQTKKCLTLPLCVCYFYRTWIGGNQQYFFFERCHFRVSARMPGALLRCSRISSIYCKRWLESELEGSNYDLFESSFMRNCLFKYLYLLLMRMCVKRDDYKRSFLVFV